MYFGTADGIASQLRNHPFVGHFQMFLSGKLPVLEMYHCHGGNVMGDRLRWTVSLTITLWAQSGLGVLRHQA